MRRTRRWYNRFGIEEPFPILPAVAVAIPTAFCLGAMVLGVVMF